VFVEVELLVQQAGEELPALWKYMEQFPDVQARMESDVLLVFCVLNLLSKDLALSVEQLAAGRDASFRLFEFVSGAGFPRTRALYYWLYEMLCRELVSIFGR
jgi:hypothetical protein